jgi:predicted chitinase
MIISHKYKFIFIKTRKTAGTTIEYNLSKYLGNDDIIAPSDQANYLAQNYIQKTSLSRFFEVLKFKKLSKNFYFEFTDHMRAIHIKKKLIIKFTKLILNFVSKENLLIKASLTILCEKIHQILML